jgi:hypothetical protein
MLWVLLVGASRSEGSFTDPNFPQIVKIYNQANEFLEWLRISLASVLDNPFFAGLRDLRSTLIDYRNDYLSEHQQAYDAHHAELDKIRKSWGNEAPKKK